MKITVVTTFSPDGYAQYGWRFVETFQKFWPPNYQLVTYYEEHIALWGADCRDIKAVPERAAFYEAHRNDPVAHGLVTQPCWKRQEAEDGASFRTNAMKFCNKVFAVQDAMRKCDTEILVWIDADVYTFNPVPERFIKQMMDGVDLIYLGRREGYHSECGFIGFRLPAAAPMIEEWARMYSSGDVFSLDEWHDSYVFDWVRRMAVHLRQRSITRNRMAGHPWFSSPLGDVMDHMKGMRKEVGHSAQMVGKRVAP